MVITQDLFIYDILGEDPVAGRTPSGLFYSDHAGVVAELSLPR